MTIKFFFNETSIKLSERTRLRHFIGSLFSREGKLLFSLDYIFCSDKYLLSINRKFLNHDNYTDVITFSLSDPSDPIVGEIYISAERVKENSMKLGVAFKEELHRVIFHGALHLCGYLDKTKSEKNRMTLLEDKYLNMYFF